MAENHWQVAFGRLTRDGVDRVAFPNERLQPGDVLTFVGSSHENERVCAALGEPVGDAGAHREGTVDVRRIFLSNRRLAGMTIERLNMEEQFGARVTRIRRGDADMVPPSDFVLELGDRLRVVAPTARMKDVGNYLGDSYQAVGEVEMLTFALGHAMGLLVGALAVTVGGVTLKLGFAGGPLCVACCSVPCVGPAPSSGRSPMPPTWRSVNSGWSYSWRASDFVPEAVWVQCRWVRLPVWPQQQWR